jgi:hypothetical protein
MANYSPEPWTVEHEDGVDAPFIKSPLGVVAQVFGGSVRASEMERLPSIRKANARLIAAAPDLLAAMTCDDVDQLVEGIEHFIIGGDHPDVRDIWQPYIDKLNALRVAIAKAEGQVQP